MRRLERRSGRTMLPPELQGEEAGETGRPQRSGGPALGLPPAAGSWIQDLLVSLLAVLLLLIAWFIWVRPTAATPLGMQETQVTRARVDEILEAQDIDATGDLLDESELAGEQGVMRRVRFRATLLRGPQRGEQVEASQQIEAVVREVADYEVRVGSVVLLQPPAEDHLSEAGDWRFVNYYRIKQLLILGGLFALGLILYGRRQGLRTLVSLALTCAAVFAILIPAILHGQNVRGAALLVCIYTVLMTYSLVNGVNRMTLAASLACVVGLVGAGLLSIVVSRAMRLTGLLNEESYFLHMVNPERRIDLQALLFAAILIGSLGAVMDVAMSIASALREMLELSPETSRGRLLRAGLSVGRDIMGTMTNTLILAYIGSQLVAVLLMVSMERSMTYLLNVEAVVVDILQALIGSIGLLLTLPAAALISATLFSRARHRDGGARGNGRQQPRIRRL